MAKPTQVYFTCGLCLLSSYKTHDIATCILIGCSYRWLHPVKTKGEEERRWIVIHGRHRCSFTDYKCFIFQIVGKYMNIAIVEKCI
jgi:hypothetical protein